jgi:hypothetical protein
MIRLIEARLSAADVMKPAQRMSGELGDVKPGQVGITLDDQRHGLRSEGIGHGVVAAADATEDRADGDLGRLNPFLQPVSSAEGLSVEDRHGLPLAFLIGFGAAEKHVDALVVERQILNSNSDQFRSAERASEPE